MDDIWKYRTGEKTMLDFVNLNETTRHSYFFSLLTIPTSTRSTNDLLIISWYLRNQYNYILNKIEASTVDVEFFNNYIKTGKSDYGHQD